MNGLALDRGLDTGSLATADWLDWVFVNVVRDRATPWARARDDADKLLQDLGQKLEMGAAAAGAPDAATWGLTPEAMAATERTMQLSPGSLG